jgi:hypothetical protein
MSSRAETKRRIRGVSKAETAPASKAVKSAAKTIAKAITGKTAYFTLKWIAIICMIVDHTAYIFLNQSVVTDVDKFYTYTALRTIGRIAFPIFAFELVEAFYYTKSRKKKLFKILLLAVFSEALFDTVIYGTVELTHQNTCFTLFIGYVGLIFLDKIYRWQTKEGDGKTRRAIISIPLYTVTVMIACLLGRITYVDYGVGGIALIFAFWFFRKGDWRHILIVTTAFTAIMMRDSFGTIGGLMYIGIFLSGVIIGLYKQDKLPAFRTNKFVKVLGAWFYPIHLIILGFIKY